MNVYETITNRIISQLESGVIPWRKDWSESASGGVPVNKLTGKAYRGINVLSLLCSGYSSNEWLTYKQAQELGGQVRKGESGSPIVFWSTWQKSKNGDSGPDGEIASDGEKSRGFLKQYYVFNLSQIEGITGDLPFTARPEFERVEAAEGIAGLYLSSGGPSLAHGGSRAYYSPSRDAVQMPNRSDFLSAHGYYSTLFHELAHSTGSAGRLNRKELVEVDALFGTKKYADEELVAEFTAGFLCAEAGISNDRLIENQAAYIANWLHKFKDDSRIAIFAAQRAQKASDYILQREAVAAVAA